MNIRILDRTLCAENINFIASESFGIAEGLIKAGVAYIEIPSSDFVKVVPDFDGYVYKSEKILELARVANADDLKKLKNTTTRNDNIVVACSLVGVGFMEKLLPTELAVMHLGTLQESNVVFDLIFDYIKPRLNQAWGYDGLCALSAECHADEEYMTYFYSKGYRASEIRNFLAHVDMSRSIEFSVSYAEELLANA